MSACNSLFSLFLPHQDGIISVKDIDLVMSEGLGMRYAFIGPMETMHLNAPEGNVPSFGLVTEVHHKKMPLKTFKIRMSAVT